MGIGLGIERFNNPNSNTLPLFIDVRYYFSKEKSFLYLHGNIGQNLKLDTTFTKGGMANLGIGYKFFATDKIALVPSIGYDHRFLQIEISNNLNDSDLTLSALSLSLGILF